MMSSDVRGALSAAMEDARQSASAAPSFVSVLARRSPVCCRTRGSPDRRHGVLRTEVPVMAATWAYGWIMRPPKNSARGLARQQLIGAFVLRFGAPTAGFRE